MRTKEYDLTRAALYYASACWEAGDWAVLRDLNFSKKEIDALCHLTLGDINLLAERLSGHILKIEIDRERFWLMLSEIEQERATEQLKTELVCREAPADMMRHLFDMSDREYTAMRRKHRRPRSAGRPADPDTATMDRIWQAWQRHGGHESPSADELLAIADATDLGLRTVWRFIRKASSLECAP